MSAWSVLRLVAADIKIAHSVFALPFALLAACMAIWPVVLIREEPFLLGGPPVVIGWEHAPARQGLDYAGHLFLIILAMVAARTVAMLANRLLDQHIDVRNPRTAGRAIPSGKLTPRAALHMLIANAVAFMLVCAAFFILFGNPWPVILGLPVLAWISSYALFKRFTWGCHLFLGSSLAISPIAAAIAIDPDQLAQQPALWMLSGMVLCWVAGFDIIYALQDVDIDQRDGLYSVPARFGERGALLISRLLHTIAVGLLVGIVLVDVRFSIIFGLGVGIVLALLIVEQTTVARWGTSKIALTFFTLNGVISCLLGLLGIADLLT